MRSFVLLFLLAVIAPLALVAWINYTVNPYDLYPTRSYKPVSLNDLDRVLADVEKQTLAPQVVVFGSSRSRQLLPEFLTCVTGQPSANDWYAGATPQGYYALASFLFEQKRIPQTMIIGLDVEAFHNANLFGDKVTQVPRLRKYIAGQTLLQSAWLDFTSLLSIGQLSDSLAILQAVENAPDDDSLGAALVASAKNLHPLQAWSRHTFGAPAAGKSRPGVATGVLMEEPDPEDTGENQDIKAYLGRFANYTALSEEQTGFFESLLALAQSHRVHVKVFITSLHPDLIQALDTQGYYPKRYSDVMVFVTRLATRYPFELYDFSHPDSYGGTLTDWENTSHINAANGERLVHALYPEVALGKCVTAAK